MTALLILAIGLAGQKSLSPGEKAMAQMRTYLISFEVPGPYRFRKVYVSGTGKGKICQVMVLDGENRLCTGESNPGDSSISLVFRDDYTAGGPRTPVGAAVPMLPQRNLIDAKQGERLKRWVRNLHNPNPVSLTDMVWDGKGTGVANFSVIRGGLPWVGTPHGYKFTFSVPDGRFNSFNAFALDVPPLDNFQPKLRSTSEVEKAFRQIFLSTVIPEEQERHQTDAQDQVARSGATLRPYILRPNSFRIERTKLGYYAPIGAPSGRRTWAIHYQIPPDGTNKGRRSMLVDAVTGKRIEE